MDSEQDQDIVQLDNYRAIILHGCERLAALPGEFERQTGELNGEIKASRTSQHANDALLRLNKYLGQYVRDQHDVWRDTSGAYARSSELARTMAQNLPDHTDRPDRPDPQQKAALDRWYAATKPLQLLAEHALVAADQRRATVTAWTAQMSSAKKVVLPLIQPMKEFMASIVRTAQENDEQLATLLSPTQQGAQDEAVVAAPTLPIMPAME